jgi:hypothetical protein
MKNYRKYLFAFLKQKNILAIQYIIQTMSDTTDQILFDSSMQAAPSNTSPFTRREMVKIKDMSTSGNYSSGQVIFETVSLSNGGRWCDYTEAFITIPTVCVISGVATVGGAVVDWTANHIKESDMLLVMKNSNLNLINSCQIDYGNRSVVQQTDHINDYLIFKQHTEMSAQDEELHGATIGYGKDTARSWYWDANNGVCNNKLYPFADSVFRHSSEVNSGAFERAKTRFSTDDDASARAQLFGADSIKQSNRSYIRNTTTHKAYYHNAIVRLKDLPFFQSMPSLLKGGNFKITLTLNQCQFQFSSAADAGGQVGALSYITNSFNGKLTNPVMVSSNVISLVSPSSTTLHETAVVKESGASATLPASSTFTVSVNVARPQFSVHAAMGVDDCQVLNCELNVPVYDLKPANESLYLQMGQKKVVYNEVLVYQLLNKAAGSTFSDLITNGLSHMKRLIIVPTISQNGTGVGNRNGAGVDPRQSPFDTVPSTCSPYILENLQVQIANQNVYANPVNYSYEMFLQEMNGRYGTEGSLYAGVSSSRISMQDYIELYGYIVVDLKRKYSSDESVPLSVSISGKIKSLRNMDFLCFIEQEKSITIDIATGQRLS